jgi:hypothetical protein
MLISKYTDKNGKLRLSLIVNEYNVYECKKAEFKRIDIIVNEKIEKYFNLDNIEVLNYQADNKSE